MSTKVYDINKPTMLEGFGVSFEKQQENIEKYIHGSREDIVERICNDESLPPNERYLLLIEFGVRLVFDEVQLRGEQHAATVKGSLAGEGLQL